jgi:hypothetical protein
MKPVLTSLIAGFCLSVFSSTYADPYKDESGHGRYKHERQAHRGGEYKEEYWDGNCKVERKWERNGNYKEERKCEGQRRHGYYAPPGVVVQPPAVVIQPSITMY